MAEKDIANEEKLGHSIRNLFIIAALAAIAYGLVMYFLITFYVHTFYFLNSLTPFITVLATLILVGVTRIYVTETKRISDVNSKNLQNQVILEIQKTYRSPELGYAVRSLWNFYDNVNNEIKAKEKYDQRIEEYGNDEDNKKKYEQIIFEKIKKEMLKRYMSRIREDTKRIEDFKGKPLEMEAAIQTTLDTQRRLASYFNQHLYDIIQTMKKIDPNFINYVRTSFWDECNEQTTRYVLIPLEEKIFETIKDNKRVGIPPLKSQVSSASEKLKKLLNEVKGST
jgi:hypothetical protein